MDKTLRLHILVTLVALTLWSSSEAATGTQLKILGEVKMNADAGRGGLLFATLQVDGTNNLTFLIDTGTPDTLLDKSFEAQLGKRFGTRSYTEFDVTQKAGVYTSPKLFLGNTELHTGSRVFTFDLRALPFNTDGKFVGILGMDCLNNYCIQLDFGAGRIRFIDANQHTVTDFGRKFALKIRNGYPSVRIANPVTGKTSDAMIDTGCNMDGVLKLPNIAGQRQSNELQFQEWHWDGCSYTNLVFQRGQDREPELLGLRFLARHLVTLDSPGKTIYLKQTSVGPLTDQDMESALQFLRNLKNRNQAPGWPPNTRGRIFLEARSETTRFDFCAQPANGSFNYHYSVARSSSENQWTLQKAWRTDITGKIVEEYLVP